MLSYVVIASTRGEELDPEWIERVAIPDVDQLPFRPDQYLTWTNRSRSVHLSGWQAFAEIGAIGTPWFIDGSRLTAFSGIPIRPGAGWTPGRSWAEQLAAMMTGHDVVSSVRELAGTFTAVSLDRERGGSVVPDSSSTGLLYHAEMNGVVVVSNQASLVARAITPAGSSPARDWSGPGWLFLAPQPFSRETGYAGVRVMARGEYLEIDSTGRASVRRGEEPHGRAFDSADLPLDWIDRVDRIACDLGAVVRSLASTPFAHKEVRLDGSPVSRMLLASILHEGLGEQFTLRLAAGGERNIVQSVAEAADISVICDEDEPETSGAFERRMKLQAFQTGGCLATADWSSELLASNSLLLAGGVRDGLTPGPFANAMSLVDRLGLSSRWNPLAPEVQDHYRELLLESDAPADEAPVLEGFRRRMGPYSEVFAAPRVDPLALCGVWRLLGGSPALETDLKRLAVDVTKRLHPELAAVPFFDSRERSPRHAREAGQSLVERHGALLESFLLDQANSIQELVQVTAMERLLRGNDPFAQNDQVLLGAFTAALWLGGHDQKSTIDRPWKERIRTEPVELDLAVDELDPISILRQLERIDPIAWSETIVAASPGPPLTDEARVLAIIPHHHGERWLADCIEALLEQTRPLQGIVVIDDASDPAPTEIVERYPSVTLLQAGEPSGPYRLIDQVMMSTDYDAFLLQDADDFSATDRLELLLAEAVRTGAEMVGSQGLRILVDEGEVVTYSNPQNASAALEKRPAGNPMHHPACLISRDLVVRIGGFCTGLRFSGDTEFLRRAGHVADLRNIPQFCYMYRTHGSSLTGSTTTGLDAPIRRNLWRLQHDRAERNAARRAAGLPPLLMPMAISSPVELTHLSGPALTGSDGTSWPNNGSGARSLATAIVSIAESERPTPGDTGTPRPVFVIGAPRSGISMLTTCLGQHSNLTQILDPEWLPGIAESLQRHYEEGLLPRVTSHLAMTGIEPEDFIAHLGASLNSLLLHGPDPDVTPPVPEWDAIVAGPLSRSRRQARRWVAGSSELTDGGFGLFRLFPHARFIHIVRNPDEVVASLSDPDGKRLYRSHYVAMEPDRAYEIWMERVEAAYQLERALGAEYVQRVDRQALFSDPEGTLRRCLAFIEEPFERACLRPLV